MFTGLDAVLQFHYHEKIPNLYSIHSWCGLATFMLFVMQVGTIILYH